MNTRRMLLGIAATLAIGGLPGCRAPTEVSGAVVLYTSVPADVIAELELAFEEEYPAVDLQVYRAGTGDVMARINEEIEADHLQADLLWVADFTVGDEPKDQGVLLPYTPPEAEGLLDTLKDEDGAYFAARLLNMVPAEAQA